jgi:hypothetical protein
MKKCVWALLLSALCIGTLFAQSDLPKGGLA